MPRLSELTIDETGVTRHLADGSFEHVDWSDLVEVVVVTSSGGPWSEDVFFMLAGSRGNGCAVPSSEAEEQGLLERLQKLPGFDKEKFGKAMHSVDDARFVVWRRKG